MQQVVRSAQGAYLQTCHYLRSPYSVMPHTTLNEKFGIHSTETLEGIETPSVAYFTVGNGGHSVAIGADSIPLVNAVQHIPQHAALYGQLPFVLREPDKDLTAGERARYRLRRIEYHDSKPYVAYYLRVLDLTDSMPQIQHVTIIDGVSEATPFEATSDDLSPTPPVVSNTGVNIVTGDSIFCSSRIPITMSREDVAEFVNAVNIIYGSEDYAIISEIALCSGIDRQVTGDFNGVSSTYTDALAVQVINFISAFYVMAFCNDGFTIYTNVGSLEPLLSTVPTVQ